MYQAEVTGAI